MVQQIRTARNWNGESFPLLVFLIVEISPLASGFAFGYAVTSRSVESHDGGLALAAQPECHPE